MYPMECVICGTKKNLLRGVCIHCVCAVPDCESIALHHGRCYQHTTVTPDAHPCTSSCWQCQKLPDVLRGEWEVIYYSVLAKRNALHPICSCCNQEQPGVIRSGLVCIHCGYSLPGPNTHQNPLVVLWSLIAPL